MTLSLSGTFMDTMSSGSSRAGIPSCVSATSNAYNQAQAKTEEREKSRTQGSDATDFLAEKH